MTQSQAAYTVEGKKVAGWIGVDLDGTLAEYHGWVAGGVIGKPIPAMVKRVQEWLAKGQQVKIFTARAAIQPYVSTEEYNKVMKEIQDWCLVHLGVILEITCLKDMAMIELWDDRCVQVIPNQGIRADGLP